MHILIVEDDPSYIRTSIRRLEKLGHSALLIAESYAQAIAAFEMREPDLIICDNDLSSGPPEDESGLDAGFHFITEVRRRGFLGRIILFTGNSKRYFVGELDISLLNVRYIQKARYRPKANF